MTFSTFTLKIETGNDAFGDCDDEMYNELSRILEGLAEQLDNRGYTPTGGKLYDFNGNAVGEWVLQ